MSSGIMKVSAGFILRILSVVLANAALLACTADGDTACYVNINSGRGWTYPIKFRMDVPAEGSPSLEMCMQIAYPQSSSYFPSEVVYRIPVGIHIRNSFSHVVSDTIIFSVEGRDDKGMLTLSSGVLSAEREVVSSERMLQWMKEGEQTRVHRMGGGNRIEITLSPVKDDKGAFSAACAGISAIGLRFKTVSEH